jgi:hypothetical protein
MISAVAEALELVVGRTDGDHLTVRVLGRMHPEASDYWDGNWLISPIIAQLGAFTAHVRAGLRLDELRSLKLGLERMHQELRGEATLASLENWISLTIVCRPNGTLAVTGTLNDEPDIGNVLQFGIDGLDQTDVPAMLSALAAIERNYPILGQP